MGFEKLAAHAGEVMSHLSPLVRRERPARRIGGSGTLSSPVRLPLEDFTSMNPEFAVKKTRLLKEVPGYKGYDSHTWPETDWLILKYLAGELEKVRDRLADLMINRQDDDPLREKFRYSLKTLTYLKAELTPAGIREGLAEGLPRADEELVLDADLALLDKVEGLHTPLDSIEDTDSLGQTEKALNLFDEGLAEVDDLFQLRRHLFREGTRI
jgi:hypothetical protein